MYGGTRVRSLATVIGMAVVLASCKSSAPGPELERFDPEVTPNASEFPDVPGVVLLDRGTLFLTADPTTRNPIAKLRHYRRIKILREAGLELARIVIPYDPGSIIAGLIARAHLPSGDRIDVDTANAVDTPHESGRRARSFQVQGATTDTIIEYAYDLYVVDPRFIAPWVFQSKLPTMRSEYAVVAPPGFTVDLRYSEAGEFVDHPPERFDTDEGTRFFWSESNLPARFSEPGMPTADLLSPRAHVIMVGAKIGARDSPGFGSWDDVAAWFVSRVPNWQTLSPETIAEAKRLAGETSLEEKSLKLLSVVARDLAWEPGPQLPLWQTRTVHPEIVLKEKRGNAVTRGLLLVSLLRAIGIAAEPALAAYRDRGVLLPDLPTVSELDAVVAVIPRNQGPLVLDPSQLSVSADVPPARLQGTRIVVLHEEGTEVIIVPTSQPADSKTSITYDLKIDERGDLFGSVEARLTGAEAGELRRLLFTADPGAYAEVVSAFLKGRGGAAPVDSANILDMGELRRPLGVKGTISLRRALTGEGTSVALRLSRLIGSMSGLRLREVRRAPLRIGAPREEEVIATISLPEDYETEGELPAFTESWTGGRVEVKTRSESARRIGVSRKATVGVLDVPRQKYAEYRQFCEALSRDEDREIPIKRPPTKTLEY